MLILPAESKSWVQFCARSWHILRSLMCPTRTSFNRTYGSVQCPVILGSYSFVIIGHLEVVSRSCSPRAWSDEGPGWLPSVQLSSRLVWERRSKALCLVLMVSSSLKTGILPEHQSLQCMACPCCLWKTTGARSPLYAASLWDSCSIFCLKVFSRWSVTALL